MVISRRNRKILTGLVLFFAAYTLIGFLALPYAARIFLEKRLSRDLDRVVTIQKVSINPYTLTFRINGFIVEEKGAPGVFLSFEELYVNLQVPSIVRLGPVVKEVRLVGPYAGIVRLESGGYNFSDLLKGGGERGGEGETERMPVAFSVNNIQISGGRIDFNDMVKGKVHEVRDLRLMVPFVSNLPGDVDIFVTPAIHARVNDSLIDLEGRSKAFHSTLESRIEIAVDGLSLPRYQEYSPVELDLKVAGGTMNLKAGLSFLRPAPGGPGEGPTLSVDGTVELEELEVNGPGGGRLLALGRLFVEAASIEPLSRKIHISKVLVEGPSVWVKRGRGKEVNIMEVLPGGGKGAAGQKPAKGRREPMPRLLVDELRVEGARLGFEDDSPSIPFRKELYPVDLAVTGLSLEEGSRAAVSLSFRNKEGESLSAEGEAGVNPVAASLKFDAKGLKVAHVRSYVDEMLRIIITDGHARAGGTLAVEPGAGNRPWVSFRGGLGVVGFKSVTREGLEDFLNWKGLDFTGVELRTSPFSLNIKGVALSDFYSRIIVKDDGRLNLQDAIVRKPAPEEGPAGPVRERDGAGGEKEIRIETVTLQGGRVNFTDRHIRPGFDANLTGIGGRVSGLFSDTASRADVDLIGSLDGYAPLEITGEVNPFGEDLFVDLKLDFKDFDLSSVTPYAGKYVGYKIAKGKLVLDLEYRIESGRLKAENRVVLDQITFGERVESEQATRLPVRFALNVLKNRKGEVHIDLPVSGSLDDPEFSVAGVVIKLVVKLVVKAATSPFAVLGALVGGGEELSYAEFPPGADELAGPGAGKLESIAEVLYQRPALSLEISAFVDPERDAEALRAGRFLRSVKEAKLREMVYKGEPAVPLEEVEVTEEEFPVYLWEAYKLADFPKPRNVLGLTKRLPPEELEKLMLTHIRITDEDLSALASRRAESARAGILATGKVEPARVFIVRPESIVPAADEEKRMSRVEFTLK